MKRTNPVQMTLSSDSEDDFSTPFVRPAVPNNTKSTDNEIPTPTGGLTKQEYRRAINLLLERCKEWNNDDKVDEETEKKIVEHVKKSEELSNAFEGDRGPQDLFLACLHAKEMSAIVRQKSDSIGGSTSGFKFDSFVTFLRENHREVVGTVRGEYSVSNLASNVVKEGYSTVRTAPFASTMVGMLDKEAMSASAPEKVKKKRAAPRRMKFDETKVTKHVELAAQKDGGEDGSNDQIKIAMDQLHILEIYNQQNGKAMGLFNFTMDKNSFAKTIEYIYYLGFLVRDGHISIKREGLANLVVKPETPPNFVRGELVDRKQHIFHISPRLWKKLAQASQGEDIITAYKLAHSKPPTHSRNTITNTSLAMRTSISLPRSIATSAPDSEDSDTPSLPIRRGKVFHK